MNAAKQTIELRVSMDQWTRQKRDGQTTEINIDLGQLSAYHKVTQSLNHLR